MSLKEIFKGFTMTAQVLGNPEPYIDPSKGFDEDRKNLRMSMSNVVNDMNKVLAQNVKS